jgi:hypothetical protein
MPVAADPSLFKISTIMEKITDFRADHEPMFMVGGERVGRSGVGGSGAGRSGRSAGASMIAVSCDSQTQ